MYKYDNKSYKFLNNGSYFTQYLLQMKLFIQLPLSFSYLLLIIFFTFIYYFYQSQNERECQSDRRVTVRHRQDTLTKHSTAIHSNSKSQQPDTFPFPSSNQWKSRRIEFDETEAVRISLDIRYSSHCERYRFRWKE